NALGFDRAAAECFAQRRDGQIGPVLLEQLDHHHRDGLALDLQQWDTGRHLGDGRAQHVNVLGDVGDEGEGVEVDRRTCPEFDIGAAGIAAELLEGFAEVHHPDLGADRAIGPVDLFEQHRLALARRADDREIHIAGVVVQIHRDQLA
ncbi:hypothetical protein CQR43_14400, partial [Enterococcus faecium]